jgi:hypothetical protein
MAGRATLAYQINETRIKNQSHNLDNAVAVANDIRESNTYLGQPLQRFPAPVDEMGDYKSGTLQVITKELYAAFREGAGGIPPGPATSRQLDARGGLNGVVLTLNPGTTHKSSIMAERRVEFIDMHEVSSSQALIDSYINLPVTTATLFQQLPDLQQGFHLGLIDKMIIGSDAPGWNNAAAVSALGSTTVPLWADLTPGQQFGWGIFLGVADPETLWNAVYGGQSGLNFLKLLFLQGGEDRVVGVPMAAPSS